MNHSDSFPSARTDEQAALWAAKIDGSSLSTSDRADLEGWLAEDSRHRALLSRYCQFSADLEQQLPVLVASGAIAGHAERPARQRQAARIVWLASTLAAAAAIVAVVWTSRPAHQTETETVATSLAERRTISLADGTRIELNARTSLLVDLGTAERHVRMADGEAYFTVAKDASRPFIVETPAGSVRVTGTVFDVHADSAAALAVTVVEGSVQVRATSSNGAHPSPVALRTHDALTSENGQIDVRSLSDAELDDALAWRHGEIVFDGTSLSQALAKFARFHGLSITAAPAVAGLRIGGRYSIDDVDAFLSAIEAVLPVQVSRESNGAILVNPREGALAPR